MFKIDIFSKIIFRNALKYKSSVITGIVGLAVTMAVCILLSLWIRAELGHDRFHRKADRIDRVTVQYESAGKVNRVATTPAPLATALLSEFPDLEKAVRFGKNGFLVFRGDKCFLEDIMFADPEVFAVFDFPLVQGDPGTALNAPDAIVISEKCKEKYFGAENPLGQTLRFKPSNDRQMRDYRITGVFKNIPADSHLKFDILGNFSAHAEKNLDQWGIGNYYTYVLRAPGATSSELEQKTPAFIEKYRGKEALSLYKTRYHFQPLPRIHLYSRLKNEISPNGDIGTVYIFSTIALLILVLGCLNHVNLSLAFYSRRAREIGLCKVFGAGGRQLTGRFVYEAFLPALLSLPLALLLVRIFLPLFNDLSGKQLTFSPFSDLLLVVLPVGLAIFAALFSGIFPALSFRGSVPADLLRAGQIPVSRLSRTRKLPVFFQFTVSVIFIIGAVTILAQLNYIRGRDLGFSPANIINIPIYSETARQKYNTVKNHLLEDSRVRSVTASSFSPGKPPWTVNYWYEGMAAGQKPLIHFLVVDGDFLETFGIQLLEGRNFAGDSPLDREGSYILNQAAAGALGRGSPLGKQFKLGIGQKGPIIGVIKDFHSRSLHHEIKPLVLYFSPRWFGCFSLRVSPRDLASTLVFLGQTWRKIVPDQPFSYSFFEEDAAGSYQKDERLLTLFIALAFLAMFIAGIGLFGLVSFSTEQRGRELGIRKVLGAPTGGLALWLTKPFFRGLLAANALAWPIGWYGMQRWLENFAYRIDLEPWIFLLSGVVVCMAGVLTVGLKTWGVVKRAPILGGQA